MTAVGRANFWVGFVVCQSAPAIARLKLQPISSGVFQPLGATGPTGAAHAAPNSRARPQAVCGRSRIAPMAGVNGQVVILEFRGSSQSIHCIWNFIASGCSGAMEPACDSYSVVFL